MNNSNQKITGILENVNCLFCHVDDTKKICQIDSFHIVQCRICGLVYVNPRLTDEEIQRLYNEKNYYESSDPYRLGYAGYIEDEHDISRTFSKKLNWIKKYIHHNPARVLDVGAAFGFFLKVARQEHGWQPYGVELNDFAAQYAREHLHLNVITGTLEDAQFPDNYFDLITLWDLIEHVRTPVHILKEAARIIKPDGLLVVQTPNVGAFIVHLLRSRWEGYRPKEHLFYFSNATVKKLLESTGFRIIKTFSFRGGKICSLKFILERIMSYRKQKKNKMLKGFYRLIKTLHMENRSIYVDVGDNLVIYAMKDTN